MLSKAALQAIEAIQAKLRALDAKPTTTPAPTQKQGAAPLPAAVAAGAAP
jgi:hypothetical protein